MGYEIPPRHDKAGQCPPPPRGRGIAGVGDENHQRRFIIAETWQRGAISQAVRIQIGAGEEEGLRLDVKNLRGETRNISEILSRMRNVVVHICSSQARKTNIPPPPPLHKINLKYSRAKKVKRSNLKVFKLKIEELLNQGDRRCANQSSSGCKSQFSQVLHLYAVYVNW